MSRSSRQSRSGRTTGPSRGNGSIGCLRLAPLHIRIRQSEHHAVPQRCPTTSTSPRMNGFGASCVIEWPKCRRTRTTIDHHSYGKPSSSFGEFGSPERCPSGRVRLGVPGGSPAGYDFTKAIARRSQRFQEPGRPDIEDTLRILHPPPSIIAACSRGYTRFFDDIPEIAQAARKNTSWFLTKFYPDIDLEKDIIVPGRKQRREGYGNLLPKSAPRTGGAFEKMNPCLRSLMRRPYWSPSG